MQYCPHKELADRANVIVAGTAVTGTSHVISPFPNGSSQLSPLADTSAGIARHCIENFENGIEKGIEKGGEKDIENDWLSACQLVSSDKFSVDALTGLFGILDRGENISHDMLESIARMALYEHGDDRDTAHIVFILNSWMHPESSPLNDQVFQLPPDEVANVLFEELLPRLSKIIGKVDYLERYWIKEEEKLELTERLFEEGAITLGTVEEVDLTVVKINPDEYEERGRLFGSESKQWHNAIHTIALHNQSPSSRMLLQSGQRSCFYYRAESLCLAKKDSVPARKDLATLARQLNQAESSRSSKAKWLNDPLDVLKPTLQIAGGTVSSIGSEAVLEQLIEFLQI